MTRTMQWLTAGTLVGMVLGGYIYVRELTGDASAVVEQVYRVEFSLNGQEFRASLELLRGSPPTTDSSARDYIEQELKAEVSRIPSFMGVGTISGYAIVSIVGSSPPYLISLDGPFVGEPKSSLYVDLAWEGSLDALKREMIPTEVNAREWPTGITPLLSATHNIQLDVMEFLLDQGADPNIEDKDGVTPLMYAVDRCSPESVMLLVKAGANPEERDHAGLSTLSRAESQKGKSSVCSEVWNKLNGN